ncbi:MAG: AAA family ATPase [Candidatus Dormibacteraceae bacterium]
MTTERKLVTILFADMVGSTAMAGDNDPEVVRGVMTRYFERLAEIATTHGGTVEKFAGDSVMVVFGVPVVHDDDAERAVRAALAARQAVGEMNAGLPIAIGIRIGVNSGEAVTAPSEDRQFMVSGDTVNVAARIQQGAEPGEVLVGSLTETLTRDVIDYEGRLPLSVKGKPEPVPVFAALRARTLVPTQARGIPGLRAPLIGRERELRLLKEIHGRVRSDRRPHLFTLVGGGGIGKSRLVAEALTDPALVGARVLRGRCLPYGQGITYWPLVEMLGGRVPDLDALAAEQPAVRARLAVLLGLSTPAEAMPDVAPERVAREIEWAVKRYVQTLCAEGPVVLVVDDLQWAEDPLIELIDHLTDRLGELPLLVLAIARPDLLEKRPGWGAGKPNASTLTLDPLDPAQTHLLISSLLDLDTLPVALRERIVERSEGTPLYCEELLRMLIDDGRLVRQDGGWTAGAAGGEITVPHSIQALLAARLDGLAEGEKTLLQAAAVIGERFQLGEIAALVGEDFEVSLEGLFRKGLVREGPGPDEATFHHLLLRDAAYSSLSKSRRADLHESLATLLESQLGGPERLAEIIGHHAQQAFAISAELRLPSVVVEPRARRAASWALILAERAGARREVQAMEAAMRGARNAAAALPDDGGDAISARLAMLEARVLTWNGRFPAAREAVARAAQQARAAGMPELLADAMLVEMWLFSQAGEASLEDLGAQLVETVTACRAIPDERREIEARSIAAWRHWSRGDLGPYLNELNELLARARALGDEGQVGILLGRIAGAEVFHTRVDASEAHLAEALAIAHRLGLQALTTTLALGQGSRALLRGDLTTAEGHFRRIIQYAEESGSSPITGLRFLSYALDPQGRFLEGAAAVDRAIGVAEATGDRWNRSELNALRARFALELGEVDLAARRVDESLKWLRAGDVTAEAEAMHALGRVRAAQGLDDAAETAFRRGFDAVKTTDFNWPRTLMAIELAEFLIERGRSSEAATAMAEVEPWLRVCGWHLWDDRVAAIRAGI